MKCDIFTMSLPSGAKLHRCKNCTNSWINRYDDYDPKTECGESISGNGLGDRLEMYLEKFGVTQERYKEVKEKFGLPPTCGCSKRKAWFNKVGEYLGVKDVR